MSDSQIINFHGIGRPERELPPGEANYWISPDRFCDILDRIVAHPDRKRISITFDDGNTSDLAIAVPELERRGLQARFFVLSGRIGQRGSLDADDIRNLMRSGMQIGSHGADHRDWTALGPQELEYELVNSRSILQEICGQPIRHAAIPFGRYDRRVLQAIRVAGYEAAYSSDGGSASPSGFLRPRTSVKNDMTLRAIENILSGYLPPLGRLRRAIAMARKRYLGTVPGGEGHYRRCST